VVEICPRGAGFGTRGGAGRVPPHPAAVDEINHQAAVAGAEAGGAVAATAKGDIHALVPGEVHGGDHIGHLGHLEYGGWTFVDHAVVHGPGGVVIGMIRRNDVTPYFFLQ